MKIQLIKKNKEPTYSKLNLRQSVITQFHNYHFENYHFDKQPSNTSMHHLQTLEMTKAVRHRERKKHSNSHI